jgi:hypothetical protein
VGDDYYIVTGLPDWEQLVPSHPVVRPEDQGNGHLPQHLLHCCTSPGMSKVTIGTGCFLLTNVGVRPIMSNSGLISTVAFKLAGGPTFFGLESSVGCAGQALEWLNVGLGNGHWQGGGGGPAGGGRWVRWSGDSASIWRVALPQVEARCWRCYTGVRSAHQAQALSQGHHGGGGAHAQGGLGLHDSGPGLCGVHWFW